MLLTFLFVIIFLPLLPPSRPQMIFDFPLSSFPFLFRAISQFT